MWRERTALARWERTAAPVWEEGGGGAAGAIWRNPDRRVSPSVVAPPLVSLVADTALCTALSTSGVSRTTISAVRVTSVVPKVLGVRVKVPARTAGVGDSSEGEVSEGCVAGRVAIVSSFSDTWDS